MRYVSPFALLAIDGTTQAVDRQLLQQTRKRLLAEFELAGNAATVTLNGKEFTKSEILELLDGLQDQEKLGFHQSVHRNSGLLKFLLHDQLPQGGNLPPDVVYANKKFIAFLSPYFQFSYEQALDVAFRKRDVRQLRNLNNMPLLVETSYEEACFRPVRRELQKINNDIETAVQGRWPYRFEPREVELMANTTLVQCVDELPARMQATRDDYASHLLDLALYVWNNCNHDQVAIRLLGQVDNMKAGLEIKRRSTALRGKMRTPPPQQPTSSFNYTPAKTNDGPGAGRIILIALKVIVLLFIVARACNRGGSSSSYKNYNFDYLKNMPDYTKTLQTIDLQKKANNVVYKLGGFIRTEQYDKSDYFEKQKKLKGKKRKTRSLETGTYVYENCFKDKPRRLMQRFMLVNSTTQDAVFMIGAEDGKGACVYVKAGGSFVTDTMYVFNGVVMAYAGEDWNDTLSMGVHYFSDMVPNAEIIGGFTRPCENVNSLLHQVISIDLIKEMHLSRSRSGSATDEKNIICGLQELTPGLLTLKRIGGPREPRSYDDDSDTVVPESPAEETPSPVSGPEEPPGEIKEGSGPKR